MTNEADAELALQVSNALTQALLQYRMKNMPASVSFLILIKVYACALNADTGRTTLFFFFISNYFAQLLEYLF